MNKKLLIVSAFLLILTGCDQKPEVEDTVKPESETIVETSDGDYRTVVPQPTSEVRGVANNTIDNDLDLDAMETGLMNISKEYADPDKYIYQPGTIISSDEATYLTGPEYTADEFAEITKSDTSAQNIGLNMPLDDGNYTEDTKQYVNTIVEQDYFTYDEDNNKQIDKVAIGFGMDPTYNYTDSKGKEHTVDITDEELNEFANSYVANKMTEFIRSKNGYENVEIIYGFFKESETELYPGTYYAQGYVAKDEDTIKNIKKIDQKYVLFPTTEGKEQDKVLNQEISDLEQEVRGYFSYNTGASARGYYEDNNLKEIYIRLTVNTYSQTDLIPFVNFVEEKVTEIISENVKISVDIRKSTGESEAIIVFDKDKNVQKYLY